MRKAAGMPQGIPEGFAHKGPKWFSVQGNWKPLESRKVKAAKKRFEAAQKEYRAAEFNLRQAMIPTGNVDDILTADFKLRKGK